MPSRQSEAVRDMYASWTAARLNDEEQDGESWGDLTAEPGGVDYLETDADGVPAMWAVPKGCVEDRVLLCMHGGGFVGGSIYTHRKMFGHLAKAAGVRALIVHYGLARPAWRSGSTSSPVSSTPFRWPPDAHPKPTRRSAGWPSGYDPSLACKPGPARSGDVTKNLVG
jgi:alpha/beta hydrolase fold